jgi:hypothetical protein
MSVPWVSKLIQRLPVSGNDGNEYWLQVYQAIGGTEFALYAVPANEEKEESPPTRAAVIRLKKGRYQITHTKVMLTSNDGDAP